MSIVQAVREGMRSASRHRRALLLVYLVNLGLAAAVAIPVGLRLDAELANTESAVPMAETFDWLWHSEFRSGLDPDLDPAARVGPEQRGALPLLEHFEGYVTGRLRLDLPSWLQWYAFLYTVVMVFMTGGILGLFCEPRSRFTLRLFSDRAGRYFLPLLAVLILSQILYLLLWGPLGGIFRDIVSYLEAESATEWNPVLFYWVTAFILMVLAFAIHMVMDYARVVVVAWERLGILTAVLSAFGFCRHHAKETFGVFYLVTLIAVGVAGVFALSIGWVEPTTGPVRLILMALVQQAMIATLIWVRMVYLGSQLALYRGTVNMPEFALPVGPSPNEEGEEPVVDEAALVEQQVAAGSR